ncbi:tripartite motif-containing protein 2-like [Crassostrea angulata]|uniref:tripartite motif-containing protein 2-like n=1 Tax=Magallana angulata TaxID=2784310 RepID=UPI0022B0CE44|nr:tripartite motif-containing protein 2-like [Crassostrea angulata]
MDTASSPYRAHSCSKCPGDTEYYCVSCPCDLCPQCKENHVKDLQTIDHDVVSHRDKLNYIPTQEICVRHPGHVYTKYCEPCQVPACNKCQQHKKHKKIDVRTAYNKTKRQQHRGTIHTIRSEALFYRPVLLTGIKTDVKTCHTEFSLFQSEISTKAPKLKNLINKARKDFMYNVFCDFDFKHRCLKQMIKMSRHIVSLQEYEHRYVQPAFTFSALQFLSFTKTALPQIHLTLHTSQLSMTESLIKEDVMESLSAIQITERGNRRVGNQCLLKLTFVPEFHQSLTVTVVNGCFHISCVTSDRVWVSDDWNNLMLTDTTGVPLHHVEDSCSDLYDRGNGLHTVKSESELIYIDRNYNINKLSKDMKTTTTFMKRTDPTWRPHCVYWSPSTGDLLVGMYNNDTKTGKVTRYNQSRQLTQTIEHDNTGRGLYSEPLYITENNNGDVVVSDYESYAVVVTEHGGRHRFSYTGHPSGSGLRPCGICTDALSHILVCDDRTNTVQMLDRDGQFLSHLLIRPSGIFSPYSLSYDVNTHRLWVGSRDNNTVVIYRYITRQDALTDLNPATADVMESPSEIPTPGTEKPQQGNQCLLKLMSPPVLLPSLTVTGVYRCYHISCVTSDRVWVSDWYNIILTDTTGVPLHRVEDSCCDLYNGLHTVNSESELIYIDRNYNINKLSKDMKTTTTFIERTYSTWRPQCVYWSPSTGDLLVAMYNNITKTGKVTRYNQSGQLTQTIEHDNTGLGLYSEPIYITENNNGDVVVSDYAFLSQTGAVVVTERGGRHRFSYTGHPSGSGLGQCGICTDALSHILVCDDTTQTVQMIDRDGQFLSHLLIKQLEKFSPQSLSYDVNTHRLWVGSGDNNTVVIYRYITRQDALTDEHTHRPDGEALSSSTPAIEWR